MTALAHFFTAAAQEGRPLTGKQQELFQVYLDLLLEWNERINLTAVRAPSEIGMRHFLDALQLLPFLPAAPLRLIDVGSGAGFPGVPLKIMRPDITLTLVESVGKKCDFLRALSAALALSAVTVLPERAELLGQDTRHREQYDVVTARAVAELRVLVEYLLPLCAPGGLLLAPKGEQAPVEAAAAEKAVRLLGGAPARLHALPAWAGAAPGLLVEIRKTGRTPRQYPRRVGVPGKRPL